MKPLHILGYVLLVAEALFVLGLALSGDIGDDAAGRGMALGFAMVLAPIVLLSGAAFVWGSSGGPSWAYRGGLGILALPLLLVALRFGGSVVSSIDHAMGRAQYGRFDDAHLSRIAAAVDAVDLQRLDALLREHTPDFQARDLRGHTLLGHAVFRALEYGRGPEQVEPIRRLLAAGAKPARDALSAERTQASVTDHELVYAVFGVGNEQAAQVLDALLTAGADPNVVDEDGRPIYFSTFARKSTLEVLARHGVTFRGLDTRSDLHGYTALMGRVVLHDWELARFFLSQGADLTHVAKDGKTLRTLLAEVDPPGSVYAGKDAEQHALFLKELAALERQR